MVASSQELTRAAERQIRSRLDNLPPHELNRLTSDALGVAEDILKAKRWELPASTRGIFLSYLRSVEPKSKLYHYVARVLRTHFHNAPNSPWIKSQKTS